MKLQELIDQTDLDMGPKQVEAFFLGVLSAQKPLPFPKALEELLSAAPESKATLEGELKKLWDKLKANYQTELENLFNSKAPLNEFLTEARDQLDYFLTALSLSGTHADSVDDEDLLELMEELEDTVMEIEDYLAEDKPSKAEGEEMKEMLLEAWKEFVEIKQ